MARRHRPRRQVLAAAVAVVVATATLTTAATARPDTAQGPDKPTIRYTEYGIPHIIASTFEGLGEGYGYAAAKDNICTLASTYLMVEARRSKYLGPDGHADTGTSGGTTNLNSDLYFQRMNDDHVVEKLVAKPAPDGPEPEVRQAIHGYVEGYNRYLAETGVGNITDPACRGAAWVQPITDLDVYRHVHAEVIMGTSQYLLDGEVGAAPAAVPADSPKARPAADTGRKIVQAMAKGHQNGIGSNALAVGADGVSGGGSMLLGNPHFPWQGKNRMWETQLTIPGKFNVAGASLLGFPVVNIGHNDDVAWSHTVATVAPFGLFDLQVDPLHPTRYLVDGTWRDMTSQRVSVEVRNADGSTGTVTRTLWSTRYGPVTTSLAGVPLPWVVSAHAVRDANMDNLRAVNTWFGLDRAKDTDDVVHTLESTQGSPFFNTLATDRKGHALYADIQAAPNITDAHAESCLTLTGRATFYGLRMPGVPPVSILDGKRSACDWPDDPNAVAPGLLDPKVQPRLIRTDFVGNANDSPWLANPAEPLSYPRVMGDTDSTRTTRTQQLILTAQHRIDGTDGLPGKGFTPETMRESLFADRSRTADLARAATVRMCKGFVGGLAPSNGGLVDVHDACPVLAAWDGTFTLHSRGAWLFENFWNSLPVPDVGVAGVETAPWKVGFDPKEPLTTPNTLDTDRLDVKLAFGNAVAALRKAGIPLDATVSDVQTVTRNGERIPIHGSLGSLGVLNVIDPAADAQGNPDVVWGSSFIQEVRFGADGPPQSSTLLTYSQSADPTSPHYADQTTLFSAGKWVTDRYTEDQIAASPVLETKVLD
ncbi:penicillin acylase family protein [Actinocatenispora rupis]|uniref:Penicillin amidase n=1 Tax=Actinocatenispora rupis TaxID=519421 RepID=A0A8J3NC62_9ACTN|nr:penicillin acylase family protein [Actinocatenispora rupis]GID10079.1 penicillin amidase [Actinocatenispora rupis]